MGSFIPIIILGILGLLMGLFLAYASKKFEVKKDEKVELNKSHNISKLWSTEFWQRNEH